MLSQIRPRLLGGYVAGMLLSGCTMPAQSLPVAWTSGASAHLGAHLELGENTLNRGHSLSSLERPVRVTAGVVSHNGANLLPGEATEKRWTSDHTGSGEQWRR